MASGRGAPIVVALLITVLPVRVGLDVLHGLPIAGVGSAGRLLGASLGLCMLGAGLVAAFRDRRHPLLPPAALFAALLVVAAARSVVGPAETARLLLLYAAPVGYAFAVSAWMGEVSDQRRMLGLTGAAALVPMGLSAAAWMAGQPQEHVLHGYPRLLGAYSSHHNHAVAMVVFACVGGLFALRAESVAVRLSGALLGGLALLFMGLTWVRTTVLMVGLVAFVALALRGRWRLLVGLVLLGIAAVLLVPALRDRFSDVGAVLTSRPPEEGWGAVGSWRVAIWADSLRVFAAQGPAAWLGGLGLGAHRTLHRHLDPHQEYLALWFQLGILGPTAWVWMWVIALRDAARVARRSTGWDRDVATLTAALVVAVLLTSALSNDFLPRALLAAFTWGLCGLVWARRAPEG